jgi:3-oxoacyl-ACP reductase-like protein
MSIFGSIKDAIFGKSDAPAAPAPAPTPAPAAPAPAPAAAAPAPAAPAAPAAPEQVVDIAPKLNAMAAARGGPTLDWQHSIVDLMKLVGIDSSLQFRKELATELGYTGALDGSAEMNTWLHAKTMERLTHVRAH